MKKIVGVRFKTIGKIYYFDPENLQVKEAQNVIVETVRGVEFATIVLIKEIDDNEFTKPLKPIIRIATEKDKRQNEENRKKEKEALELCEKKIEKHGLDMKLVDVEYTFDQNKLLFYFTAEGRIDFRELVKDLATVFRTRIELRQIGVRDEAKTLGSVGICGRNICCAQFLGEFVPVSIKMAKEQGLSLNPSKISGACGRLMCCLKYEEDMYEECMKNLPRVGSIVKTPSGEGKVESLNVLKNRVYVKIGSENEQILADFSGDEVKILKNNCKNDEIDENLLKSLED